MMDTKSEIMSMPAKTGSLTDPGQKNPASRNPPTARMAPNMVTILATQRPSLPSNVPLPVGYTSVPRLVIFAGRMLAGLASAYASCPD